MRQLFLILFITFVSSTTASDSQYFVSEEHGFSMQYPKTWNRADTIHSQTVIRVESPDGEDYNIVVAKVPVFREMTTQQYAESMLSQVEVIVRDFLAKSYPDVRLIKKGKTQLSQQPAVYYIVDYTLAAAGVELLMRNYTISTKYDDKQYILTFRTPQLFFDEYFPMIQVLALGFQLTKVKPE